MTISTVDNDVVEHDLMLTVVVALHTQILKRANFHAVMPGGENRLGLKRLLRRSLFEAAGNLPRAKTGKLQNEKRTDDQGQPRWQRLFDLVVQAILSE